MSDVHFGMMWTDSLGSSAKRPVGFDSNILQFRMSAMLDDYTMPYTLDYLAVFCDLEEKKMLIDLPFKTLCSRRTVVLQDTLARERGNAYDDN